jgi:hypothetical protein
MSDEWPLTVTDRADVYGSARDLTASDADRICHELDELDDDRAVVWGQDWIMSEKPLETVEAKRRVALAWVIRETDKAVGVTQVPPEERSEEIDLVFLPKSQARVFEKGGVESLATPQSGLGDYGVGL